VGRSGFRERSPNARQHAIELLEIREPLTLTWTTSKGGHASVPASREEARCLTRSSPIALRARLLAPRDPILYGSVQGFGQRLSEARSRSGVTWEAASALDDTELETKLFRAVGRCEPRRRVPIDFEWMHRELRRTGVTLQTLCIEYQEAAKLCGGPQLAYQYSQFCDLYAAWKAKLAITMRQTHRSGEKAFIDFSGKKPHIVDRQTGELIEVVLFVMVLGASNYTYAEATMTQSAADFIDATVHAFEHFGCVPETVVHCGCERNEPPPQMGPSPDLLDSAFSCGSVFPYRRNEGHASRRGWRGRRQR
jgi:hypothetical protein